MALGKAVADPARGVAGSSLVTAMSRNGTDFGIRLAGTGDRWFTAPVEMPRGLYFPGFTEADANPDMGDSTIVETVGLGGFAMAAAPAVAGFVGAGSAAEAAGYTRRMYEITLARNVEWTIPGPRLRRSSDRDRREGGGRERDRSDHQHRDRAPRAGSGAGGGGRGACAHGLLRAGARGPRGGAGMSTGAGAAVEGGTGMGAGVVANRLRRGFYLGLRGAHADLRIALREGGGGDGVAHDRDPVEPRDPRRGGTPDEGRAGGRAGRPR